MAIYTGDIEMSDLPSAAAIADTSGAQQESFVHQPAGHFEILSFWGLLILVCGGLVVFQPLILPGWLDSMVLADMVLHGWVGDNPELAEQFFAIRAIEPGQLPYLILAGIDAAVGPVFAPVFTAILGLILFVLALHALVQRPGARGISANGWPLSIVALTAVSGVVLHRYSPSILLGLTFGIAALAAWRHRFEAPDIIGTILLTLALTLTMGMDFQIFVGVLAVLVLSLFGDGVLEAIRLGGRRAAIGFGVRLVLLIIAVFPAAIMQAVFVQNHDLQWSSVLTLAGQTGPLATDYRLYTDGLAAFTYSSEPVLILGLVVLVGLVLLAGLVFRVFHGRIGRTDFVLIGGGVLLGSAFLVFNGTLFGLQGQLTGARAFWLGLILLIAWAAQSPLPRPVRRVLMVAVILVTASLTGNRVLTYEHLAQQANDTSVISSLVKKGSFVIGLDLSEGATARRVAGLSILQQSGIGLTDNAFTADAPGRLLESNPPLGTRPGRDIADILGTDLTAQPETIRLEDFRTSSGQPVGSVFVMSGPAGGDFLQRLALSYEPVYRFASGSMRGLVLYQPRPRDDIKP